MLPDRVSNPGPLTYESGALPIALRGPAIVESEWRSVIVVSLNVGDGFRHIKPAKLFMCSHYKHDEDGRTAPCVRGHGSVPLSHSGNVVMRIGLHTHTS